MRSTRGNYILTCVTDSHDVFRENTEPIEPLQEGGWMWFVLPGIVIADSCIYLPLLVMCHTLTIWPGTGSHDTDWNIPRMKFR